MPEISGNLDLSDSYVAQTGGVDGVTSSIESHPATPANEVPTLTATGGPAGIDLAWQAPSVPGITGYEVFYTPTPNTPFGATPVATVSSSTLSTAIANGASGYYAVSAIVDGVPTMYNSLAEGTASSNVVDVHLTTGDHNKLMAPSTSTLAPVSHGTINLNQGVLDQTIDGFGGTLTDSAAADLMALPVAQRDAVMNQLFNPVTGAGISVIRISMGASDFSPGDFTYDDMPAGQSDPTLSNFSIHSDPNSAIAGHPQLPDESSVIPILLQAESINPNIVIIASPWTAPPWMKTNNTAKDLAKGVNPYTAAKSGTLQPSDYGTYAQYFVKFIEAYADQRININYVTVQNEPENATKAYPGMLMSASQEVAFINSDLAPAFSSAGVPTQILGYDHNWNDTTYPKTVLQDAPSVVGTAWHCYAGSVASQSTVEAVYPNKLSFITECSGTGPDYPTSVTDFANNLNWDSKNLIVGGLNNWASGVQLFNLALDQNCGPQLLGGASCIDPSPKNAPCEDCRGVVTVNTASGTVSNYNVDFYLLSEASAAFAPGARRIGSSGPSSLYETAAVNSDGTTGLYVSNPKAKSQTFSVDDGGLGFTYTIPASSVASFRWSN